MRISDWSSDVCSSDLIETRPSSSVINGVTLRRRSLRKLATTRIQSVDELFGEFMVPRGTSTLTPDDFSHLRPHFRQLKCLLADAVRNSRRGVNVLLYGRSEERRLGKEGVGPCRARGSPLN